MRIILTLAVLLTATAAAAQPDLVSDDFVDPRQTGGRPVFISRLVFAAAANSADEYRPRDQNVGFLTVANNFYWRGFQFGFQHTEMRAENDGAASVSVCRCDPDVYFPTAPSSDATPAPPLPSPKETVQFAFYYPAPGGAGGIPTMLRARVWTSWQSVDTVVTSVATGQVVERLQGREETRGLETDTYFRIGGREIFGSLVYASTERTETTDDRKQRALTYTNKFPAIAFDRFRIIVLPKLTVGGVTNRGGTALNVVSPSIEVFRRFSQSRVNVRLVWSPLATRDGNGWELTQQVALVVDRALVVKLFH